MDGRPWYLPDTQACTYLMATFQFGCHGRHLAFCSNLMAILDVSWAVLTGLSLVLLQQSFLTCLFPLWSYTLLNHSSTDPLRPRDCTLRAFGRN